MEDQNQFAMTHILKIGAEYAQQATSTLQPEKHCTKTINEEAYIKIKSKQSKLISPDRIQSKVNVAFALGFGETFSTPCVNHVRHDQP